MEGKIVFIKVVEIISKEGKKYFKLHFLTEDYEYHEQFIESDLMVYITNKKFEPLSIHKATFKIDKDLKLRINTII